MSVKNRTLIIGSVLLVTFGFWGCGSSRTQKHAGVEIKLLSISRMAEYQVGMQRAVARGPDNEIAVVQVEFSPAGASTLKLPATECELKDTNGNTYLSDMDLDFGLGSGERVMVWDLTFAVPKTASLKSLRVGTAVFDLRGARDFEPTARVTPGSHPRPK